LLSTAKDVISGFFPGNTNRYQRDVMRLTQIDSEQAWRGFTPKIDATELSTQTRRGICLRGYGRRSEVTVVQYSRFRL